MLIQDLQNAAHLVICEGRNLPTCGKHFHDRIILLNSGSLGWAIKTSFVPPFFKVSVRNQECVLEVSILPVSTMFRSYFGTLFTFSVQSGIVAQVIPSHLHFCLTFKCCCTCSWSEDAWTICPCTLSNKQQSINQTVYVWVPLTNLNTERRMHSTI